jgi:plastocyanin
MALRTVIVGLALALAGPADGAVIDVKIQGSAYQPASVTIAPGDTVHWTNGDFVTHTVTSDTAGQFESGDMGMGATFSHTFDTPGSYPYHCVWHGFMTGTVTVLGEAGTPLPPALRVGDRRVREGDGGLRNAVFVVRLSAASAQSVQVSFRTANGTARRRSDYRARSGTVTFAPGETLRRVVVRVVADRRNERNETFWLVLSGPVAATLADARGRALIVDDD